MNFIVRTALLLCCSAAAAAATAAKTALRFGRAPHGTDLTADYTYDQYVRDFRIRAPSVEGRAAFQHNLRDILAHSANPRRSYTKGVNELTGSSKGASFPRGRAKVPKKSTQPEKHRKPAPLDTLPPVSSLPDSVSWVEYMTAVKNQGSCGSCWAFSTTQVIEAYFTMATGLTSDLSVQQIMTCTPNPDDCGGYGGCSGGVEPQGFAYVADSGGLLSEWQLGYQSFYGTGNTSQVIMVGDDDLKDPVMNKSTCDELVPSLQKYMGALATVGGYVRLPENNATALMATLATVGPLTISVDASTWGTYESGVYDGCSYEEMDMDHAVTLVGYGTDTDTNLDYWLVRNSWGPTWGEEGYIRLARTANEGDRCGVDVVPLDGVGCKGGPPNITVCGTCGLLYDTVYPTGAFLA